MQVLLDFLLLLFVFVIALAAAREWSNNFLEERVSGKIRIIVPPKIGHFLIGNASGCSAFWSEQHRYMNIQGIVGYSFVALITICAAFNRFSEQAIEKACFQLVVVMVINTIVLGFDVLLGSLLFRLIKSRTFLCKKGGVVSSDRLLIAGKYLMQTLGFDDDFITISPEVRLELKQLAGKHGIYQYIFKVIKTDLPIKRIAGATITDGTTLVWELPDSENQGFHFLVLHEKKFLVTKINVIARLTELCEVPSALP